MHTIRRYAADDAHVIYGSAYDDSLGHKLRVMVIATGPSSVARKNEQRPGLRAKARFVRAFCFPRSLPVTGGTGRIANLG